MPVGDGANWDETNPTNSTLAVQIDDYDRDLRIGVRSRMMAEHEWPSSQSATNQAGQHKFITMQNQASKPTVSGTQLAAVYTKTVGSGLQEMFWENEAGTEVQLTNRSGINFSTGQVVKNAITVCVTATSGSTAFTIDNNVPTTGSGFSVVGLATTYTPIYSTSVLLFDLHLNACHTNYGGAEIAAGIFTSGTACAVALGPMPGNPVGGFGSIHVVGTYSPGTTAAIPFTVRVGNSAGGSVYVNGDEAGNSLFGGKFSSVLKISEIIT